MNSEWGMLWYLSLIKICLWLFLSRTGSSIRISFVKYFHYLQQQWSATFSAPGTGFMEGSFSEEDRGASGSNASNGVESSRWSFTCLPLTPCWGTLFLTGPQPRGWGALIIETKEVKSMGLRSHSKGRTVFSIEVDSFHMLSTDCWTRCVDLTSSFHSLMLEQVYQPNILA